MHVFLAGASGAIGRQLIPLLTRSGHTVTGTTRSATKADALRALGAEPVVLDGLDRAAVLAAVVAARPDAVLHEMTAIESLADLRRPDRAFAATNRLRTEGTDNLLAAARAAGVERIVVQSFAGWPFERVGGPVKDEDAPLDPHPPARLRTMHEAIRHLERVTTEADGIVLRYGGFYGPGTSVMPGGEQWEMARTRKAPTVGDGNGVWAFVHIEDAAAATVAALERGRAGEIYHVCDDDPAPTREWVPALCAAAGGKPPRHVPRWIARLVGEHVVAMTCEIRGASNAKAKRELGWTPRWPSWRESWPALAAGGGA
ncbi:MAG TPA: NAD(P)-dependent oxidoreductase [Conexibacter sp.]|nr:NAD(P)-dependent oxidoreductase [Conexibacter sp.]